MVSQCPKCGAPVAEGDKFCQSCGAPLTSASPSETGGKMASGISSSGGGMASNAVPVKICPKCGTEAPYDALYCPNCEASLENVSPTVAGQPTPTMGIGNAQATGTTGISGLSSTGSGVVNTAGMNIKQFKVVQKMFSFRPIYHVKDMNDRDLMIIKQRFFNFFSVTLDIETPEGEKLGEITGNFWRTTWEIRNNRGELMATIKFPFISWFGKTFEVILPNGEIYTAGRSYFHREFRVSSTTGGQMAFEVNKKYFSLRDTFQVISYGVLDDMTTLATVAIIDKKYHSGGKSHGSSSSLLDAVL